MATLRAARLPDDAPEIAAIDTSFQTATVFSLNTAERGLEIEEIRLATPIRKVFPLDDLEQADRPWTLAFVAVDEGRIVGFAAAELRTWNRRTVLWHLYVDAEFRGEGIGRQLLERIEDHARQAEALHIWLETSNLNMPGFRAYQKMGFTLTGLDTTLYDGTDAEGEFALFLSRPVNR